MKRIYFMKPVGMDGPIKIGCSDHPERRLMDLSCWSPVPLELLVAIPGSLALERNIHECFSDSYSHREWFHASDKLKAAVTALVAGKPVQEAIDLEARVGPLPKYGGREEKFDFEGRRYFSFRQRSWWAEKRAAKVTGEPMKLPADVTDILNRWSHVRNGLRSIPTDAEFSRMAEVFRDPAEHCKPMFTDWKRRARA